MNRIAKESAEFRKLMFEEAGARKGIDAAVRLRSSLNFMFDSFPRLNEHEENIVQDP